MPTLPELSQAEALYFAQAPQLFGLCYLHAAGPRGANALLHTLLCDLLYSPRRWRLAQSGRAGLFRCAHLACLDQNLKRPKRKKEKGGQREAQQLKAALPFSMSDGLRALLRLPAKYKTPLYLHLGLGWSLEETAAAAGGGANQAGKRVKAGLKRAGLTQERAQGLLSQLAPGGDSPQRVWDSFLTDREEKSFAGRQRLRRFKRWLDNAVPYIALAVVALCACAYWGVEYGWFSGQPYAPSFATRGTPSTVEEAYGKGKFTVFAPEGAGFVRYDIADAPLSLTALVGQMVALGGAPEGTFLLSASYIDGGGETHASLSLEEAAISVTLELSQEAADWFAAASPQERQPMLRGMAHTIGGAYGGLDELHIRSGGTELAASGKTAQAFLGEEPAVARRADAPYRE